MPGAAQCRRDDGDRRRHRSRRPPRQGAGGGGAGGGRPQPLAAAGAHRRGRGRRRRRGRCSTTRGLRLAPGTEVVVRLPPPRPIRAAAEAIPLDIVFEDADLLVIDKPAGLVVHPAPGAAQGTLVNALLHHCGGTLSGIGGRLRPGIVHRIDKDTSGLLVVAKSDAAHRGLARQFAAHDLERRYLAVTHGAPDPADPRLAHLAGIGWEPGGILRVEGRIGRHPGDRKRMAVLSETGKPAVTRARVLERFGPEGAPVAALVECRLETGRTHQIRVHMAFAGHPLVGDAVYGRRRAAGALGAFPAPGAARGEPRLHPSGHRRGDALRLARSPRTCRRCSRPCAIVTKRRCATNRSSPIIEGWTMRRVGLRWKGCHWLTKDCPRRRPSRGCRATCRKSAASRCWSRRRNSCWPRPGSTTATRRRRTSSSPATCASPPRSPWATAATACPPPR